MIRPATFALLLLVLAMLPAHGAEAPIGLFTIVDGDVVVLRDTHEFAAAEGQQLRSEDIVRSRDDARLARIELDDGTLLDIGPATELLLQPRALATPLEVGASLYLLRGWLKVSAAAAAKGAALAALASPQFGVTGIAGTVVVHAAPQASLVFVESGRVEVLDRVAGKPNATRALNDGDAFAVRAATPGVLLRRPPPDLIDGLPRAFTDSLPRRAAQWQGRAVEPGPQSDPNYAGLAPWLHAEATLRASFVKRFKPLAREPHFRASLVAELRAHPEWARVLFPEKYLPKTAAVARRGAVPRAAAAESKALPHATEPPAPPPAATANPPSAEPTLAQAPKTETP
jgi:hypothetical protein